MTTREITRTSIQRQATAVACQMVGGCSAKASVSAIVVAALLVSVGLFCVWSRNEVFRLGYVRSEVTKEMRSLGAEQELLRAGIAKLRSPKRIETIAAGELEMQYPTPRQIRTIEYKSGSKGKIVAFR